MRIETLSAIKNEASAMFSSALELETRINNAETAGVVIPVEVDAAFTAVTTNLHIIITWAEQAIDYGTEEPTITGVQNFLNELKVIFNKYSAVLERMDGSGHSLSYGCADFFRVTIKDPISGDIQTKDIVPAVADAITSADLV